MTHPESSRLSAYLDGDMEGAEAREVEGHLATCASCSLLLEDLREVQARARALPERQPDRDLWPEIARSIQHRVSESDVIRLHPWRTEESREERGRVFRISYLRAAAAVIAIALVSGASGALVMGLRDASPQTAATAESAWVVQLAQVSPALGEQATEVARLEAVLAATRDELDESTVLLLERNLGVIDQAIQECLRALETDPENRFLESHLAQAVESKASFLRQATALVAPMS